jgi:mRNA interferase MazF
MGPFVRGEVVVVPFPVSDLSEQKRRPALVLATLHAGDILLSMTSGHSVVPDFEEKVSASDFVEGSFARESVVRCDRLFTGASGKVLYRVGRVKSEKVDQVVSRIVQYLSA